MRTSPPAGRGPRWVRFRHATETTFPILQGELGLEVMIARSLSIDMGLVGRRASSVELFRAEDDLTSVDVEHRALLLAVAPTLGPGSGTARAGRQRRPGPAPYAVLRVGLRPGSKGGKTDPF